MKPAPIPSSALEDENLLNLPAQTASGFEANCRIGGNDDLLQDLFQNSTETSTTAATFTNNSNIANPFFTLDPFDPLVASNVNVASPNNLSSSNSFGNFATLQQSQQSDESLMGNWDSLLKQTPSVGARPMTLPTIPRNSSTPNLETKTKDPLAEFGNLGGISGGVASTNKGPTWGPAIKPNPSVNIGIKSSVQNSMLAYCHFHQ